MVFGKSKTNIALGLDTRIENSRNEKMYDSYIVKSFDVKTKKDGKVIAEGVTSFEMPDEAVVICNLKIEGAYKLTYELVGEDAEGLKVQFKDQKQNIIESAAYDDLVYIFISAPGYENFSVSEVSAKYTETEQNAGDVYDVTGAPTGYIVKILPSMPKGDVTFVISGEVGTQIPFKVSIDENIQNGTVTASKEDGTDATNAATTIYYENKIIVSATPDEGYELKSLKYINETTQAEVEIAYDEETNEYSFLMPASNVTITAVFELPESPEEPDDEGDDEQGGIVPDYPKYYNIYEDEICEGVTVEFSRDVVKEGQSVLVTVKVDEEFDATDLTLKFKRSLFGYWEDLTLTPTENPGEYIIKNIYTDIYVRAEGAVPTGIESIDGAKVYTKDGSIYVQTPTQEQVQIISVSGAVLKNESQVGLKQYTGLQRGVYIICIGEQRFKVRL